MMSSETGATHTGRPHDLKAMKSTTTPARAGEDTPCMLANGGQKAAAGQPAGSHPAAKAGVAPVSTSYEITRATTKFVVDLGLHKDMDETEKERRTALRRLLEEADSFVTTARNVASRALSSRDGAALDAFMIEHGRKPGRGEAWLPKSDVPGKPDGYCYSYPLMRKAVPLLSTSLTANLQHKVDADWKRDRFDVLIREIRSSRHYNVGGPIPVPRKEAIFTWGEDGSGAVTATLYSTMQYDGPRRVTLPLCPRDARQQRELEELRTGVVRSGEVTIQKDRRKPWKWSVRVAYTRKVERRQGAVWGAVTLGLRCFLAAVVDSGEPWLYDGHDIAAYLRQVQRRRQSYQRDSKASRRWGHGRTRTLRPIEILEGKADRWRASKLATIGLRLATWLRARGVTHVALEDFTGIRDAREDEIGERVWRAVQEWPYFRQQTVLASKLAEMGITVVEVPAAYNTKRCPSCGHTAKENRDFSKWRLKCTSCKWERRLDIAQAMNVLWKGRASTDVPKDGSTNDPGNLPTGSKKNGVGARNGPQKPR